MNPFILQSIWRQVQQVGFGMGIVISLNTVPVQAVALTTTAVIAAPPSLRSSYPQPLLLAKRSRERRIEVRLAKQQLLAWQGNTVIYAAPISSGKSSTPTPRGNYTIQEKYRTTRMTGRGYDIPDVPYAMFFVGGYAIHGAYWHNAFGTPVSHGCINLSTGDARWLYNWAALGTPVMIRR